MKDTITITITINGKPWTQAQLIDLLHEEALCARLNRKRAA